MNIKTENINELNAVITVKIGHEDYEPTYEDELNKQQRKMVLPGFRPGKAPAGLVKKMVGKALLADELDKLLNSQLQEYMSKSGDAIIGGPLPREGNRLN